MAELLGTDMIMFEMGTYWIFSIIFISGLDYYAAKRLGGRRVLAYKILRMPRFFALVFVSLYTIVFFVLSKFGVEIDYNLLTFFGIPYFASWIFFLVNVVRRIKAEEKGKPWNRPSR